MIIFFIMIPSITFVLSLNCDIFIFIIVIPVYISDISFIYFLLLLSYVKVSILLCIYSLYSTCLRNYKMMFVLFFLFMTYLFVISLFNLALAALPLPL